MPYEEINVDCSVVICANNDGIGECVMECHVRELNPDEPDCREFEFDAPVDVTVEDVDLIMETIVKQGIPFVQMDDSPHFQSELITRPSYCIVRGKKENIEQFYYWKSVDGKIGYTDKRQVEMELA